MDAGGRDGAKDHNDKHDGVDCDGEVMMAVAKTMIICLH